jgi:hypothetical protein
MPGRRIHFKQTGSVFALLGFGERIRGEVSRLGRSIGSKKARPNGRASERIEQYLLCGKGQLIEIDRVRRFVIIAIHLVVDGDAIPIRSGWRIVAVQRGGLAVQRDGVEQQVAIRSALGVDG